MNLGYNTYEVLEIPAAKPNFYFESIGQTTVGKIIEYQPVGKISYHRKTWEVYNLFFSNYNVISETVSSDTELSNNNDARLIFGTVLSTVLNFFNKFPTAMLMVGGSDSSVAFVNACMLTCVNKKCKRSSECRKKDRRIKLYQDFVETNYDELFQDYTFFSGEYDDNDGFKILPYDNNNRLMYVMVVKNIIFDI